MTFPPATPAAFQKQYFLNPDSPNPDGGDSVQIVRKSNFQTRYFTTPGTIQNLINKFPNRRALSTDILSYLALKNLPEKARILLAHISWMS